MQRAKIVIVVIAIVLIALIGWSIMRQDRADPSAQATAEPAAAAQATATPGSTSPSELETTPEPETTDEPERTADPETTDEPEDTAVMYEGALAGLTQEEIAEMALAEEQVSKELSNSGGEGAVD